MEQGKIREEEEARAAKKKADDSRAKYDYWMANLPKLGRKTIYPLMDYFGNAYNLYHASWAELSKCPVLSQQKAEQILRSRESWDLQGRWETFQKRGMQFVTYGMEGYPRRLKKVEDAPYWLYIRGHLPQEDKVSVAIVGARGCSEYGRKMAMDLGRILSEADVEVISGLAYGIDTYGHMGVLQAGGPGQTYAVLGCGVDICYPASNRKLYQQIRETGGILSEYAPGKEPHPGRFPERNRIISGLADVVVIVEAREKSGSLITADCALEQGRDVYAIPGRVTDVLSMGCNRLIQQGAGILLSPQNLLEELKLFREKSQEFPINSKIGLEKDELLLYSCFDILQPKGLEELIQDSGMGVVEIMTMLMKLQAKGCIREVFKNSYIRCN